MLYKIGLFLIPFENFFFAPSAGWAAIAPIIFFIYFIQNIKKVKIILKKEKKLMIGSLVIVGISFFISLMYGINIKNIARSFITYFLGIIFYFSLIIRHKTLKKDPQKDFNNLFLAYFLSSLVGLFQWLVYKENIKFIIKMINSISKRSYYPRVQFTFTEPSFTSMHLYGVILILYLFFKKENIKITKLQKYCTFIFPILAIILEKSLRLVLDTLVILTIIFFYKCLFSKKKIWIKFFTIISILGILLFTYTNRDTLVGIIGKKDPRIEKILNKGIYSDGSLASRYFRINASLKGYCKNKLNVITGYGIGNIKLPLLLGYEEARKEYTNSYMYEVNQLKNFNGHSLFCMYIKIISEFGIVVLGIILISLYSKEYFLEYMIILYLYLQFDSYAFYSMWFYLYLKKYLKIKEGGI
ncbi:MULTISPECIES: hypothetical protein [Fusobacterium]|uniref:hypothetical protein n=1 Tax=Fusobacterium TaxID=848 RepID=UPI0008A15B1A|nr:MULTISPECIES: hypothetical protein [Fusobacterium]MCF0171383.1 hypothetical protein [Fusobacterium varium]MCF0188808.1 hypothetical protein [Bacteroidaceae bacterium]OFL80981.1 hypothetical protein HMPREF2747_14345 [Fusobacterium sp. HMSC073F01]